MQKNTAIYVLAAAILGFVGGFLLANSLNRSEVNALRASAAQVKADSSNSNTADTADLTIAEIKSKIQEADQSPNNFQFQKGLGIALYRYSTIKGDPEILSESARVLARAYSLEPKDADVLIAYANAEFDLGYSKKDPKGFSSARDLYTRALELRPNDSDILTDRALTYVYQDKPDYEHAISELQRVGIIDPKHQRSLVNLADVYLKMFKNSEAEKAISKLQSIDPQNKDLPELRSRLDTAKNASKQ